MGVSTTRHVKTSCGMCYIGCGVIVRIENGVVTGIEGNPDSPQNRGKMCGKGKAGFMNLYNPNRVTRPLKRTNPQKGLNVDPGWVEISWDEALDTVAAQLKRLLDTPAKLHVQAWDVVGDGMMWMGAFGNAFGTPHTTVASSPTCGKVVHPVEFFSGGGFHQQPDLHYAKFCMLVGTQFGIATRSALNHHNLDMAEARERGMKLVVVDPVGTHAAAKADEWIPIIPGTDGALALSMLHLLLNEYGIYDGPFLTEMTNAPYLVRPNGRYCRHPETNQPMIFDASSGAAKAFDDPDLKQPRLSGQCQVHGETCRTAFDLLREHVAQYTPEKTEAITTIPAATVRRLTREFGEAACIGQTITIDGVELPYRPACIDWARGTQGHKHGFHICWLLKLVNIVVGSVNVPGGIMSTGAAGKYPHRWWPESGIDGMLEHGGQIMPMAHPKAFPGRTPVKPVRADFGELFPLASHYHTLMPIAAENPKAFGLNDGNMLEMIFHTPMNAIFGSFGDWAKVENFFRSLKFMTGFAVEINETNLFDDIIFPFPSYLERYDFIPGMGAYMIAPCGQDDFHWQIRQPVVPMTDGVRHPQEVVQELASRVGILGDLYRVLNHNYRLSGGHALKTNQRYEIPEVIDRISKAWFGEDRGLDWFDTNGVVRHPRDVEEAYIGPYLKARIPIYLEHFLARGEELAKVLGDLGLDWDLSDYKPIGDFMPCPSFNADQRSEFDLIAVQFKLPYTYGSYGNENPWIDEICEATGAYHILLNEDVGKAKGIGDGDLVWLESPVRKVQARVRLTQCVHPRTVGVAGHFGHISPGMPIARGKGVNFNSLLPTEMDRIDLISTALDHCVEVRVYKEEVH